VLSGVSQSIGNPQQIYVTKGRSELGSSTREEYVLPGPGPVPGIADGQR